MRTNLLSLFLEINRKDFIFVVSDRKEDNEFNLLYSKTISQNGFKENKIVSIDLVYNIFKENIYLIEQKFNCVFEEIIVVINNFNCSTINFSGFKKLNGSQLSKSSVDYIINSLKSKISEIEKFKIILHIFNSKFLLDKKKIENLPIGLFGNFYSQELSFFLINKNDFKNLKNILNKCNLRIKKIISKNFIEGVKIINDHFDEDTFFKIDINETHTEIFFFENSVLKFSQNFQFGTKLITNDISKVIALDTNIVNNILQNSNISQQSKEKEFIERDFFKDQNFRKIKKSLVFDIARARIQEIAELVFIKNINIKSFLKENLTLFLNIEDSLSLKCFELLYKDEFSQKNKFKVNLFNNFEINDFYEDADKIVQYGWKKEAVPFVQEKKSFIARFFDLIFK